MTTREFYNAIVSAGISAEITAKANELISALDTKNEKRKASGTKTQKENADLKARILTAIEDGEIESVEGYVTAKTVGAYFDISTQKASPLLKQLVDNGDLVENAEVKTKSGKVKGYAIRTYEKPESADESETAENGETADETE